MCELIAQAEALEEFAEQIDVDPNAVTPRMLSIAMKQTARQYRMNAQAAQPAEPVAWQIWLLEPLDVYHNKDEAELEFQRRNKKYPDSRRKLVPLYARPDPRVKQPAEGEPAAWTHWTMPDLCRLYAYAYRAGHEDTCKATYTHVVEADVETFHEDEVVEYLCDHEKRARAVIAVKGKP